MIDVNHAISLFNQNAFIDLVSKYASYLGQNPTLDMVLAASYSKLDKHEQAHTIFTTLQQQFPTNPDIAFNDALIYKSEGNTEQCKRCLEKAIQINASYHPAHYALANLLFDASEFEKALNGYQLANKLAPNQLDYIRSLSGCYGQVSQHKQAFQCISQIFGSGHETTDDLVHGMQQLYLANDYVSARKMYQALPNNNGLQGYLHYYYALLEIDQKKLVLAANILQKVDANHLSPSDQKMLVANQHFCQFMLCGEDAELDAIQNLALSSVDKQLCVFAANLFETLGNLDSAEGVLKFSDEHFSGDAEINIIRSKVLLRRKEYDKCEDLLASLKVNNQSQLLDAEYQSIKLYESTNQIEKSAKTIIRIAEQLEEDAASSEVDFVSTINRLSRINTQAEVNKRKTSIDQNMVFIVGFPRSGTTLLESKLANVSNAKIFEETHALHDFLNSKNSTVNTTHVLDALNSLNNEQLDSLAVDYLRGLQDYVPFDDQDVIIDKMPLNGMYIDAILKLFPNAHVIVMLRDPRDICISCLKQSMIKTSSIDEFAKSYDVYMEFLHQRTNRYASDVSLLNYEFLVQNFATVFDNLLTKLGMQDSHISGNTQSDAAQNNRLFNTPSYDQVSKPVYTKAIGSFSKYADYLNFSDPTLLKWCKRLGYTG